MGKDKKKKRRLSSSSSSSSSSSEDERRRLKKLKKKLKEEQRRSEKILKKKIKSEKKKLASTSRPTNKEIVNSEPEIAADIPVELMERSKAMAPMTKEEWDKRQSVVRRVYDEDSGRYRLIKGDGEVIEEIVSRNRHRTINEQATRADGAYFQANTNTVEKKLS